VHPKIGEALFRDEAVHVEYLEHTLKKEITIISRPDYHLEQFEIHYVTEKNG
jgi:hypothetical protein